MRSAARMMIGVAGSLALLASSGAFASPPVAGSPPTVQSPAAPDAWMMLSLLGPAQAVALGGSAAAAQPQGGTPPPPPLPAAAAHAAVNGEVAGILLWWVLIAIALASTGHSHTANSPA